VTGGVPNNSEVAADRVNANKFYAFGGGKFYYSTDKGATFTASAATGFPTTGGHLTAVIGHEGDVWVTAGKQISGGATQCSPCGLWHTTDGGVTFTKLANVSFAAQVGLGMAKPGGSGYPAIFLFGQADSGILTIYRSDDGGASWIQITDAAHMFGTIQAITGDPTIYGRVYIGTNGLGMFYGDTTAPVSTNTPVTPGANTNTPTRTYTPVTPVVSNTPTRTYTPGPTFTRTSTVTTGPSLTPTRTYTAGPTFTRTPTATTGPSLTPTRTPTSFVPTLTPTAGTPTTGCSPVTSTITAPFTYDGVGAFCWQIATIPSYINSWNTTTVSVNSVNETNVYVAVGSLPAKVNGYWYISYSSSVTYAHFEVK
jgi:hypothetical protein